jgi:hypothetical protein
MTINTQKITFDEMCASGARDICHRCRHNVPIKVDRWPVHVWLWDIELRSGR